MRIALGFTLGHAQAGGRTPAPARRIPGAFCAVFAVALTCLHC